MNYYNEFDPKAAAWLRELIKAGHIADGIVDERSIKDVQPADLAGFRQCHFFAGIGGWSLALRLAGWPDDEPVWTGSCPCQPFSSAGQQEGTDDPRHLWPAFNGLIIQRRPAYVLGEQVKAAVGFGWVDNVLTDLEASGYACGSCVLGAHSVGIDQVRGRIYWGGYNTDSDRVRLQGLRVSKAGAWSRKQFERLVQAELRVSVPTGKSGGLSHGLPSRMAQLRGYGNAIVPEVAAQFVVAFAEATHETA